MLEADIGCFNQKYLKAFKCVAHVGPDRKAHTFQIILYFSRDLGKKMYELSNHLGNVLTTVSDIKLTADGNTDGVVDSYAAVITSAQDYYPFGSLEMDRTYSSENYRFGFQGQEQDNEIKGEGNSINYKYRVHDPRLGRFLSIDPLAAQYPYYSPYAFSGNRVIDCIELEGLEPTKLVSEANGPERAPSIEDNGRNHMWTTQAGCNNWIDNGACGPEVEISPEPVQPYSNQDLQASQDREHHESAMNLMNNMPSSPATDNGTISPYNPNNLNPTFLKQESNYFKMNYTLKTNMSLLSDLYPLEYGSSTTGLGRVPCLIEGLKQAPWMVTEAFFALKIESYAIKPLTYNQFSSLSKGMFKGPMHQTLRGNAFQAYKSFSTTRNEFVNFTLKANSSAFQVIDAIQLRDNFNSNSTINK